MVAPVAGAAATNPYVAAAVVAFGVTMQYFGNRKAAKAQEAAARKQAALKRFQANEMLDRFKLNEASLLRTEQETVSKQIGAMVKSGGGITSSSLLLLEDTNRKIQRQISLEKREANYKAEMLIRGADVDLSLAGDIDKASKVQNLGLFLTGAANTYKTYKNTQ